MANSISFEAWKAAVDREVQARAGGLGADDRVAMKYIIVWRKSREWADVNDWHEPNKYNSVDDAIKAMASWLWPYECGYYDVIEWTGRI